MTNYFWGQVEEGEARRNLNPFAFTPHRALALFRQIQWVKRETDDQGIWITTYLETG